MCICTHGLIFNTSKQCVVVSKKLCLCKCVVLEILLDLDVSQYMFFSILFYSKYQFKIFLLKLQVCKLSHM